MTTAYIMFIVMMNGTITINPHKFENAPSPLFFCMQAANVLRLNDEIKNTLPNRKIDTILCVPDGVEPPYCNPTPGSNHPCPKVGIVPPNPKLEAAIGAQ